MPKKPRRVPPRPAQTNYKTTCDNHPDRRAVYAFRVGKGPHKGEDRGLCQECFDEERRIARRKLRIKNVRSRRK